MNTKAARQNLLEIKEILDSSKLKFWLSMGTLLGAMREKHFIDYDNDIDIKILAKDWRPSMCKKFIAKHFRCNEVIRNQDKISPGWSLIKSILLRKRGILMGLGFEYYYPPGDVYISLSDRPTEEASVIPGKFYRGNSSIEFLGRQFRIPDGATEYLERMYGKDWETPIRGMRIWAKHRKYISLNKYLLWLWKHRKEANL